MYQLIIVDDEAFILEHLREIFPWAEMGFDLAGCFLDPAQAMDHLRAHHVDAMLTDIQLGKDTGLHLSMMAREINPQIELVLLSAYSEFEYARTALRLNVFDYLVKPVTYAGITECFSRLREKLDQAHNPAISPQKTEENYRIELSKRYIDKHLSEDINLETAASHVSMNPSYFSRFFKRHTGVLFADYLAQRRIEQAIELLRDPANKVFEISMKVGYYSKQNFYKRFRQYTNRTPEEYRNQVLQVKDADDE